MNKKQTEPSLMSRRQPKAGNPSTTSSLKSQAKRAANFMRKGYMSGGVVHHKSLADMDKSYNTMKIKGEK
jgi:hypothetical protein